MLGRVGRAPPRRRSRRRPRPAPAAAARPRTVELDRHGRAAGERLQRRPRPPLDRIAGWMPARDLLQVLDAPARPLGRVGQLTPGARLLGRTGLGGAQRERERDQPLLRAVVQVALDRRRGLVGRGDQPGAGGGELGAALGVGDRGGDELGELRHARLGLAPATAASRSTTATIDPPEPALDDDRRADRRARRRATQHGGAGAGGASNVSHPRGAGRRATRRRALLAGVERQPRAGRAIAAACPAVARRR